MAFTMTDMITENDEIALNTTGAFLEDFRVQYKDRFIIFPNVDSENHIAEDTANRSVLDLPKLIVYFPRIQLERGSRLQFPVNLLYVLGVTIENFLRFQNALIFTQDKLAHDIVKNSMAERETLQHKRIWKSIKNKLDNHIVEEMVYDGDQHYNHTSALKTKLTPKLETAARQHNAIIAAIHLDDSTDSTHPIEQDAITVECIAVTESGEKGREPKYARKDYYYNRSGPSLTQLILELADDTAFNAISSPGTRYAVSLYDFNYAVHARNIERLERRLEKLTNFSQIEDILRRSKEESNQERQALYSSMIHLFAFGTVDMLRTYFESNVFQVYFDLRRYSLLLFAIEETPVLPEIAKFVQLTQMILYDLYTLAVKENLLATWTRRKIKDILANIKKGDGVIDVTDHFMKKISKRQLFWNSDKNQSFLSVRYFTEYLLIWSSLSKRYQIAELMLEYSGHQTLVPSGTDGMLKLDQNKRIAYQMGNAIVISYMLNKIAGKASVSESDKLQLQENSLNFVNISVELFEIAIEKGNYFPDPILNMKLEFWNSRPVIDLAYQCYAREFFTHDLVQGYLTKVWRGELDSFKKLTLPSETENSWISQINNNNETKDKEIFQNTKFFGLWLLRTLISPKGTFVFHGLAYFVFVVVYTVNLVFKWDPLSLTAYDYLYFVWAGAYLLDEIQQITSLFKWKASVESDERVSLIQIIYQVYKKGLLKKNFINSLRDYVADLWHTLDVVIIVLFIVSIIIRCLSVLHFPRDTRFAIIVRVVYGILAIFYFIRTFEYVLVKRNWGLLIYTLYFAFLRMIKFLVILTIMTYCFSIAQYVLFDPNKISAASVGQLILYPPFFQIFGEYALDQVSTLVYNFTQEADPGSPLYFWESLTWLAYALIGVWVLVSNVLLLNVMISYFTKVYDVVLGNAKTIYKTLFFTLVNEYQERSFWPPPFNLLSYIYKYLVLPLFSYVAYYLTCKCCRASGNLEVERPNNNNKCFDNVSVYVPVFSFYHSHDIVEAYWKQRKEME